MRLKCINMVTNDVVRLRDFYCMALRAEYDESHGGPDRCEILLGEVLLVLCRTDLPVTVNPDCCGLEFQVEDVEVEYRRLLEKGVRFDSPPVVYPWHYKAVGFRDPDGNHIDFVQQCRE